MAGIKENLTPGDIAELQIAMEGVVKSNAEMLDAVRKFNDTGVTNYWIRQLAMTQKLHKKLDATYRMQIERDAIDGE